ncbi:hypothetical protein Phi46:1_gp41 [Cellulophaga phage phi46:1]|uniref:dATP / dGTP pyrophosphohydrolase n=1 Tax=Cellulophaga phage phi46:1 TaxID=1327974 RepID=UPI0003518F2A|nr:dATP / dGTP pyrophosphohydrolase [Cellulophaga phage phi46:1]AGO47852.1 hypothetical protein Phi46:1_gp41 [Cellulophaga phage phi46:1]
MKTEVKAFRNNSGKTKWALVDFKALEPMVKALEFGRDKYSTFKDPDSGNVYQGAELTKEAIQSWERIYDAAEDWKRGYRGLENMESCQRHIVEYLAGNKIDDESKLMHLGHAAACLMFEIHHELKALNKSEDKSEGMLFATLELRDMTPEEIEKDKKENKKIREAKAATKEIFKTVANKKLRKNYLKT